MRVIAILPSFPNRQSRFIHSALFPVLVDRTRPFLFRKLSAKSLRFPRCFDADRARLTRMPDDRQKRRSPLPPHVAVALAVFVPVCVAGLAGAGWLLWRWLAG
jgi:hypothetical protein